EVIWIDHHAQTEQVSSPRLTVINPLLEEMPPWPTSYWAYQVVKREVWLAMVGIAYDWMYMKEMSLLLSKEYPNLTDLKIKDPAKQKFETPIGKLSTIIQFNMKGTAQDAMQSIKILTRVESPYEILEQSSARGRFIHRRFDKLNAQYQKILQSLEVSSDQLYVYVLQPDLAIASELANEVMYNHPTKELVVAKPYLERYFCSVRGGSRDIRIPMLAAIEGLDASGGGHDKSCGLNIKQEDFEEFLKRFRKELYG
ncbi:MAG: DHHA1 domain-containing protein, partial [Candidatus Woesearchaeota archaeon]